MAVIELKRRLQTTQRVDIVKKVRPQIFIAHNSLSKKLLDNIKKEIETEKVLAFVANKETQKENFAEKIIRAIDDSRVFFAILTKKAFKKQAIRDWIHFEFGLAGGKYKKYSQTVTSQFQIYVWKDVATDIPNLNPLTNIEAFRSIKINSKKSKDEMLTEMRAIANRLAITNL